MMFGWCSEFPSEQCRTIIFLKDRRSDHKWVLSWFRTKRGVMEVRIGKFPVICNSQECWLLRFDILGKVEQYLRMAILLQNTFWSSLAWRFGLLARLPRTCLGHLGVPARWFVRLLLSVRFLISIFPSQEIPDFNGFRSEIFVFLFVSAWRCADSLIRSNLELFRCWPTLWLNPNSNPNCHGRISGMF